MSKEKEKLKLERREAKKLRNKIVGAGNTMDSYGDKFVSMRGSIGNKNNMKTNYAQSVGFFKFFLISSDYFWRFLNKKKRRERKTNTNTNTKIDFNNDEDSNSKSSYDPYKSKKSFSAKIYEDMEKKLEKNGDKLAQSNLPEPKKKPEPQDDIDFLS